MAGDWIPMRVNLATDPRVVAIAAATRKPAAYVVGCLLVVWGAANQHTTDGFLAAIYRDVMGRSIDAVGQREFSRMLRNVGRDDVARRLLASDEARDKQVTAIYDELLDRAASAGEVDFYSDLLSRGAREAQIISAFMASQEYAN